MAASRLEPHNRLTVVAGTEVGNPANRPAIRPTLRLSSPAPLAFPSTISSTVLGSRGGTRSTRVLSTWAARSSGRTPASAPPYFPNGVRTASYRYTSVAIAQSTLSSQRAHHGAGSGRIVGR